MQQQCNIYGPIQLVKKIILDSTIMCCKFNHTGAVLSVGLVSGKIQIINVSRNFEMSKLISEDIENENFPCTCIRYAHPNDRILIASYSNGMVKFWNYNSGCCFKTIHENRTTLSMAVNPGNDKFVTVGSTSNIYLYDIESGEKISQMNKGYSAKILTGHTMNVFAAVYHSKNSFLTGGWDNTVHFWDDRKKESLRYISGPHICGEGIDANEETDLIVTASWRSENPLQIWDYASGKLVNNINYLETSFYYGGKWISNEHIICNGTRQNVFKLYSMFNKNALCMVNNLSNSVNCSDTVLNSNLIAFGSGNGIYFLKLEF